RLGHVAPFGTLISTLALSTSLVSGPDLGSARKPTGGNRLSASQGPIFSSYPGVSNEPHILGASPGCVSRLPHAGPLRRGGWGVRSRPRQWVVGESDPMPLLMNARR